jgi:maltooligosyltrehalose trehalohydrolase
MQQLQSGGFLGATVMPDGGTSFRVWAPRAQQVAVILPESNRTPAALQPEGDGYFSGTVPGVRHGDRYRYLLDGELERPDPASRYQPEGVHGPSQVVDPDRFQWQTPDWQGLPLEQYLIYELHVGTFTTQGTFDGVIEQLDYLVELGITSVELMPVAQFPGERNWGYDGTFAFAPQNSYGGPEGLKRLVDACHARGLAVVLDVVYNHLGPEGNYLHAFGPYFTDHYRTPWGDAVNFDGPDSDPVRHFFISNALYWITEYRIDALRLDAVHGIYDFSACHILQELQQAVEQRSDELGRPAYLIAESDLNDVRLINPPEQGGFGLAAQWSDDFHHSLRTLLTNDRRGYYADYGDFSQVAKAFSNGFVLDGCYSGFRRRRHGNSSVAVPPCSLVVCSQNHDQVGNRARGERLHEHLSLQQLKLAAASVLLSPYLPLLFMGEEYGETAPFPYFVSHGDPDLVAAVRRGRQKEFADFTEETVPDPQDEQTFLSARLQPEQRRSGWQQELFSWYGALIRLRKEQQLTDCPDRLLLQVIADETNQVLILIRRRSTDELICLFNYSDQSQTISPEMVGGSLQVLLDSAGTVPPGSTVDVYVTRSESWLTLRPFSAMVCRKD